jgi:hypothetical protein
VEPIIATSITWSGFLVIGKGGHTLIIMGLAKSEKHTELQGKNYNPHRADLLYQRISLFDFEPPQPLKQGKGQ